MKVRPKSGVSHERTKSISHEAKAQIVALRVPTQREQQIADAYIAVGAVLDQIKVMREDGATFAKIQRIFANGGVRIDIAVLRAAFEKLDASHPTGSGEWK